MDHGSARRPIHLALSEHMHMNVIDGLPTEFIAVHHHPEAFFATQLDGQALGRVQDMPSQSFVVLGQVIERVRIGFFGMTRK